MSGSSSISVDPARIPRHQEETWHRNLRRCRQRARAAVAAAKLGADVPALRLQLACQKLDAHHQHSSAMQQWQLMNQISNMLKGNLKGNGGKGGSWGGKGMQGKGWGGTKGQGKGWKGAPGGKGSKGDTCGRCNATDHHVSQCPYLTNGTVCQPCGRTGHAAHACRSKGQVDQTTCLCCGEVGHMKKECPKTAATATTVAPKGI